MFQSGISKPSRKDQLNKIIQSNNPVDFNQRKGLFSSSLSRVHFDRTTQVPGARSPAYSYFHHPCHVSGLSVPRRCHVLLPYFPRPCHVFIVSAPRRWKFFPHHLISVRRFYNYVCSGKGLADKIKGFFNIQEKVAYFSQWTMKISNLGYKKNLFGNPLQLKFSLFIARKKSDLCTFEVIKFISVLKITRSL